MDTARELLKGNTPTLVLAVLKDSPLHGYGIAREIERRSGNALKFKEGTLYPLLHRLEDAGHIRSTWETFERTPPRKYYSLTRAGQSQLATLRREWEQLVAGMNHLLEELEGAER